MTATVQDSDTVRDAAPSQLRVESHSVQAAVQLYSPCAFPATGNVRRVGTYLPAPSLQVPCVYGNAAVACGKAGPSKSYYKS